jgi:hypothetical protein
MEIIFHGRHDSKHATENLIGIIEMIRQRYKIDVFREMHLSITLVDEAGEDVELIDSETEEALRVMEVYQHTKNIPRKKGRPDLRLVLNKGD